MPRYAVQSPPPLSPRLRQLIERASRASDRQARDIVALCRRRSRHYRALSGEGLESLRRNVRYLVGGFYRRSLIDGRMPLPSELEIPLRSARSRVAQGVPLGDMIANFQVGLPMLWADLARSVGRNPDVRLELLQRVPLTISAIACVTIAVTEAYVEERERLLQTREELLGELLRLLVGDEAPLSVVEARARALGVALEAPWSALLFRPAPARETTPPEASLELVRRLLDGRGASREFVVGRIPQGILALLAGDPDAWGIADIAGKLRGRGWRIGLGSSAGDAAGVRRSAREAARAAEIGELLAHEEPLHRYRELALFDVVDVGSRRAGEFAEHVLGSLADASRHELYRETLQALFDSSFRVKPAAAALGVHPHTVSYRLGRLRQRFGLDLEDSETRMRVHLALLILDAERRRSGA